MDPDGRQHSQASLAGSHKRLFGLWLICMLFGLCAVLNYLFLLMGTPLGVAVFGAFTGLFLAAALYLWSRGKGAWLAAIVLWFGWIAFWHLLLREPPSLVGLAWWGPVALAIAAYRLWRRPYFGRACAPSLKSPLFRATFGFIILMFALVSGLTLDDEAQEFPDLEFAERTPAPEQNGYTIFRQIQERVLFKEPDGMAYHWSKVPETGTDEFQKWLEGARKIVAENATCLDTVDEMLSRSDFILPAYRLPFHRDAEKGRALARDLAGLLIVESSVHLADERCAEAMSSALNAVRFGVLWAGGRGYMSDYFRGTSIVYMGLAQIESIAAWPNVDSPLLTKAARSLNVEEAMAAAFADALRGEFYEQKAMHEIFGQPKKYREYMMAVLSSEGMPSEAREEMLERALWQQKFIANMTPLAKVNMSVNWLGRYHSELINLAEEDRYNAAATYIASDLTWTHRVRNPLGSIFTEMLKSSYSMCLASHFRVRASVRATRLLLALRAYHVDNGSLPGSLQALAPNYIEELPSDPFSDKPFGFEPAARPPVLFSVGPDGKRDAQRTPSGEGDDIVMELGFALD